MRLATGYCHCHSVQHRRLEVKQAGFKSVWKDEMTFVISDFVGKEEEEVVHFSLFQIGKVMRGWNK
jgi:hypothetical protein